MKINDKDINIEELIGDIDIDHDTLKKRKNGLVLRDSQIEVLKKYDIDYKRHASLSSLLFEIEEVLTYEDSNEDLENLSEELSEMNYYNYTNK